MMEVCGNQLLCTYNHETLCIEPWGDNALRVRATKQSHFPLEDWALTQPHSAQAQIALDQDGASLVNGKIRLHLTKRGKITIYNQHCTVLLEEYCRNRRDLLDPKCSAIEVEAREFSPILRGLSPHRPV